jgi:hypothetical protein
VAGQRQHALDEAKALRNPNGEFSRITYGEVVDTNDPQQMGRLRVACPLLGDKSDDIIENIPWATYVSPLAGTTTTPTRGRGLDVTAGQVAYGMFNVPKVGTTVLIACVDGDPKFRVWLGCLHDQFLPHTMPHGRYSYRTTNKPDGPFSSTEDKIQPLYDSQTAAFTNPDAGVEPRQSYEFRTRAADVSVAGLGDEFVKNQESSLSWMSDDVDVEYEDHPDGGKYTNTQGYARSRIEDGESSNTGGVIYDPQNYTWTTPGFHSISLSDSSEHCRIRVRTTHGQQIIMDDTNERIYISTAGGKTWIEMDEVGNIDIYGERNISVHAKKDLNLSAGGTLNIQAADEINLSSGSDVKIKSSGELHLKSETAAFIHSEDDMNLKAAGGAMHVEGFAETNILAGSSVLVTGSEVHLNGPPAASAAEATDSTGVTRQPAHEPWARTMLDPTTGEPELPYDSPDVGRKEGDEELPRNPNWHR